MFSSPAVDWITVSIPGDVSALVAIEVSHVAREACGVALSDDAGWVFPNKGRLDVRKRGGVGLFSAGGLALEWLRQVGLYGEFLRALSSDCHRVTRLDVALDFAIDAPPVVNQVYADARAGKVRLTHKPAPVRCILSPDRFSDLDTGTVYLGAQQAKVRARVYDKRHERLDKGFPDPGPMVRYELTVLGDVGPSLRDAYNPSSLFWRYMGGLLAVPPGVPPWVPSSDGFSLPPRERDDHKTLVRRLERELPDLCKHVLSVSGGVFVLRRVLALQGVRLVMPDSVDLDAPLTEGALMGRAPVYPGS